MGVLAKSDSFGSTGGPDVVVVVVVVGALVAISSDLEVAMFGSDDEDGGAAVVVTELAPVSTPTFGDVIEPAVVVLSSSLISGDELLEETTPGVSVPTAISVDITGTVG